MAVTAYNFHINSLSPDHELNHRQSSVQKSIAAGGLSCLFSSSSSVEENRNENGCSSSRFSSHYGSLKSSVKYRDLSPCSILQGPNSYGNGFLRNAVGSYIDYEYAACEIPDPVDQFLDCDSAISLEDELTFSMEDFDADSRSYNEDLGFILLDAQLRHSIFRDDLVKKAFYEAEKAHKGQMRANGDPYLKHCVETAILLATIGANATVVAAGLLHDTFDDSSVNYDYIYHTFGGGVADLVQGVSKLSHLSKLARENDTANKVVEADRLHTMFLAMVDAKAVLIKLADRLHNMMTLEALPMIKQQRFAKETLEIFAPLANRLGIWTWKEQLQNLCFKHLYPQEHKELFSKIISSYDESTMNSSIDRLEQALQDNGISYHLLTGRHKSLYSIYTKMLKKKLSIDEIHDIHGLRLVVDDEKDCYRALRIVHQLWPPVHGRFKDYISNPKFNGYQSLHTVVMGDHTIPLEVQIRTRDMHLQAEFGIAAHWRYKEGGCKYSSTVLEMVEWARWFVTWHCNETKKVKTSSVVKGVSICPPCPSLSPFTDHSSKQKEPIFVIFMENETMSVQEFPANSTVKDVLEKSENRRTIRPSSPLKEEMRLKLNHKPVTDLAHKLHMGDVLELTSNIPNKSLTKFREEIRRMYDSGPPSPSTVESKTHTIFHCS